MSCASTFIASCFLILQQVFGVEYWDGLTGKFVITGEDGFFELPRALSAAERENWYRPPELEDGDLLVRCYEKDPTVCLAYDRKGTIAAIQFAIQERDVKDNLQYFESIPVFEKSRRFDLNLYVVNAFIVDQETIKSGGRDDLSAGTGTVLQIKFGGGLLTIPLDEPVLNQTTPYVSTLCINNMGDHYYYNIHDVACDEFNPVFILSQNYKIIGYGIQTFGNPTMIGPRNWNEKIPLEVLQRGNYLSECIIDQFRHYGITSTHFYFIPPETIRRITCPTRTY